MLCFRPVSGRPGRSGSIRAPGLAALAALVVIVLAYANHFANGFHFDDFHSVVDNVYIRELGNIPRFFTDATTFSSLPQNQAYRPLLLTSFALDYRLGGGLAPFQFQLTSFLILLAQCALMAWLFARLLERAAPHAWNLPLALAAATWYGVHPAVADTVNYVSARSDSLSTLLLVLALALYVRGGRARTSGVYLAAFLLAGLVKPVVVVFPLLVFAYRILFEDTGPRRRGRAARAALPALVATVLLAWLHARMTPSHFNPGGPPTFNYLITQPYVALRYFGAFLLPVGLSADTDLLPFATFADPRAWLGCAFLAVLLATAWAAARRRAAAPAAFGLLWFVIGLLPTSLFPLAEVENDHRLYLPFVGLVLAAAAAAGLALRTAEHAFPRRRVAAVALAVAAGVLVASAWGTHERNRVWRDELSLWRDVANKSPGNGRGWMNYGLAQMASGRLDAAMACFDRAMKLVPEYSYLYVNRGIALAAEGRTAAAEASFRTGVRLAGASAEPYYYYARFLRDQGRPAEALATVRRAIAVSPAHLESRHLLLELLAQAGRAQDLHRAAAATLALWPDDTVARRWLTAPVAAPQAPGAPPAGETAEGDLAESLALYRAGRFADSIAASRAALRLRPSYAEAYNNICAAYNSLGRPREAIAACEQALRLKPDFPLAAGNLRWARQLAAAAR
jgi:protein O-mannosyl-transferase